MQTVGGGRASRSPGSVMGNSRELVRCKSTSATPPADKCDLAGGDVDPTAFLKMYNHDLEEEELLFPADEDSQMAERDDGEEEDDFGEPREAISTREIEAQLRKAAREKVFVPRFPICGACSDWFAEIR